MSRLDAGEAPRPFDGLPLLVQGKVVELAARVGLPRHVLLLPEEADPSADGHGGALVVSRDHDDANAGVVAEFHRADHLGPGRVQHANATNKRETQLKGEKNGGG